MGLKKSDWEDAMYVQSACNLSGVVNSFNDVIGRIWDEANENKYGTDWVNKHPICVMYSEQINHLTGRAYSVESYHKAYQEVSLMIKLLSEDKENKLKLKATYMGK